jgi:serine/threonine protein kinase
MELVAGARLGPYEVLAPIGAGGMGQVWKARDTRLDREVAIKIIAHEKADDAALRSRFEREARALSALNHPHIVSVYDVGEQDQAQYIVSELVHGESLRRVISRGPLPPDQLFRVAVEISSALTAAHAAGILSIAI